MPVNDQLAFISYRSSGNVVTLMHTEVPQELEGQGLASAMIEKTLQYLEENNRRIIPRCSFVIAYLKRHPEWNRLLDSEAAA
jgi:predicted GNAT family acetyltransferase